MFGCSYPEAKPPKYRAPRAAPRDAPCAPCAHFSVSLNASRAVCVPHAHRAQQPGHFLIRPNISGQQTTSRRTPLTLSTSSGLESLHSNARHAFQIPGNVASANSQVRGTGKYLHADPNASPVGGMMLLRKSGGGSNFDHCPD